MSNLQNAVEGEILFVSQGIIRDKNDGEDFRMVSLAGDVVKFVRFVNSADEALDGENKDWVYPRVYVTDHAGEVFGAPAYCFVTQAEINAIIQRWGGQQFIVEDFCCKNTSLFSPSGDEESVSAMSFCEYVDCGDELQQSSCGNCRCSFFGKAKCFLRKLFLLK